LEDAIENAIENGRHGKGTVVVFSLGNSGGSRNQPLLPYPAICNEKILIVGSIASKGIASAQIVISDYFGRVFGDFYVTNTSPSVDFNLRGYPIGTYVVKLISCGQIDDTKTFVKQ